MNLPIELITEFVKATKDKDDDRSKNETTVYGTTVDRDGKIYVQIDGSELLTPVTATADTIAGERVMVMIKNHTAIITGNISSPAARIDDFDSVKKTAEDAANTANDAKQTMSLLFDLVYPVDSIYISVDSKNPSEIFGGTWELIDKEYKPQMVTARVATNYSSSATVYAYLSDHDIQFYISYTPTVPITDSTVELMTIDPTSCGATQFSDRIKLWSAFSDNGDAIISHMLSPTGVLSTTDVMVRGSNSPALSASTSISNFNSILIKQTSISYMLDSFCDKFYWKRVEKPEIVSEI